MSIRSRLLSLLAPGDADDADDPDELVFLALVQPYEAPMIREVLAQNGIASHGFETLSPETGVQRVNLRVALRDLHAATTVLSAFRGRQLPRGE